MTLSKAEGKAVPTFSKRFAAHLKRNGLKRDNVSFHSFRHNFRDAGRDAAIPQDRILKIGGWSLGETVADSYGQGASLSALKDAIEQIDYPEVYFSNIVKIKWSK